jgi:hypothetical protein
MMVAAAVMVPNARGLLELNEGRDKVTITASYGIAYDSNLYAHAGSEGDTNQSLTLATNYNRRAGLIGVNASASVTSARFTKFSSQDYTNPSLSLEFDKTKGRLTGAFSLSGQRESRSDVAANLFANSWHYSSALRLRYPINDRYYFTSLSDFSFRDYQQNTQLFDLSSYAEGVDVFYVYTSKLDLQGGYRIRFGEARGGSRTQDSAVTFGATGGILPKLSGNLRLGYQWRNETGTGGGRYGSLTSNLSLSWPMTKRTTFNFQASKDFMTAATDVSVDSTGAMLSASIKPNARLKFVLTAGVGYNNSRYLGTRGAGRKDDSYLFNFSLSVPIKTHFSASISYEYSDNDSNVAYSIFGRHTASFILSAHY